jgi:hypothetical protein
LINPHQVIEDLFCCPLGIGTLSQDAPGIRERDDREAFWLVLVADDHFQRVRAVGVPIRRNQDECQILACSLDHCVGRVSAQSQRFDGLDGKVEIKPKLAPCIRKPDAT